MVYIADSSRASPQTVEGSIFNERYFLVTSGLTGGETILRHASEAGSAN